MTLTQKGLPGGPVVENLSANAWDRGSIPVRGTKIPHAMQQLSPCSTTRGPAQREACAARESPGAATETSAAREASEQQQ